MRCNRSCCVGGNETARSGVPHSRSTRRQIRQGRTPACYDPQGRREQEEGRLPVSFLTLFVMPKLTRAAQFFLERYDRSTEGVCDSSLLAHRKRFANGSSMGFDRKFAQSLRCEDWYRRQGPRCIAILPHLVLRLVPFPRLAADEFDCSGLVVVLHCSIFMDTPVRRSSNLRARKADFDYRSSPSTNSRSPTSSDLSNDTRSRRSTSCTSGCPLAIVSD